MATAEDKNRQMSLTTEAARNLAMRFLFGFHAVRDKIVTTISEIEIAYADSPLS